VTRGLPEFRFEAWTGKGRSRRVPMVVKWPVASAAASARQTARLAHVSGARGASLGWSRSRGRATRQPARLARRRWPKACRGAPRRCAQVRWRASLSRGANTTKVAEQVRKRAWRPCFTSLSASRSGIQGRSPALARLAAAASRRVAVHACARHTAGQRRRDRGTSPGPQ
jgi:hypothetical protein